LSFSCFVYYRVSESHAVDASAAALRITELMRTRAGVSARQMKKVDEPLLWMEVYDGIRETGAFLSTLQECVEQAGLERCLQADSKRHVEIFQCA
jgi:hypothetical protein